MPALAPLLSTLLLLDLSGNEFEEQIVAVGMVTPDTEAPVLEEFLFDANIDQLYLSFSEIVDASTLNLTGITLQGSTLSLPGMSYPLTEDTVALGPDDVIITVLLGPNDQSELEGLSEVAINAIDNLAVSVDTTYLSFTLLE